MMQFDQNINELIDEDITKFSDMGVIAKKMKKKGYFQEIKQLLLKIFTEETEFTIQELSKISEAQSEEIDLMEQFWINSDIFRCNFELIIQSMSKSLFYIPSWIYLEK